MQKIRLLEAAYRAEELDSLTVKVIPLLNFAFLAGIFPALNTNTKNTCSDQLETCTLGKYDIRIFQVDYHPAHHLRPQLPIQEGGVIHQGIHASGGYKYFIVHSQGPPDLLVNEILFSFLCIRLYEVFERVPHPVSQFQ